MFPVLRCKPPVRKWESIKVNRSLTISSDKTIAFRKSYPWNAIKPLSPLEPRDYLLEYENSFSNYNEIDKRGEKVLGRHSSVMTTNHSKNPQIPSLYLLEEPSDNIHMHRICGYPNNVGTKVRKDVLQILLQS